MKMQFLFFMIFSCFDLAFSLPFPVCHEKSVHILVIFDCQGEVQEQINIINDLNYHMIHKYQMWNVVFFSLDNMNYQSYYEFDGNVCTISKIGNKIHIADQMEISKNWTVNSKSELLMSLIFIFNMSQVQFDEMQTIIKKYSEDELKKGASYDRLFLIQTFETFPELKSFSDIFLYTHSFKDLDSSFIFQKICATKCPKLSVNKTINNFMTSFYLINAPSNMSHNEAVQYCSNQNSYLLSLETTDEFEFISSIIVKSVMETIGQNLTRLHIGLKTDPYDARYAIWSSGNYFKYFNPPKYNYRDGCAYIQMPIFPVDGNSFFSYLDIINCSEILLNSVVICECHEMQNDIALNLLKYYSEDLYTHNPEFYIKYHLIDKLENHRSSVHECIINMTYPIGSLQSYFCSDYYKDNHKISLLHESFYSFFSIQIIDISKCKKYRECTKLNSPIRFEVIDPPLSFFSSFVSYTMTNYNSDDSDAKNLETNSADTKNTCTNNTDTKLCKVQSVTNNFLLEPFYKCKEIQVGAFFRCINIRSPFSHCDGDSHLQNCEHFTCPYQFFKCHNSFCILTSMINDGIRHCPLGEDEIDFGKSDCNGKIGYFLKDFCLYWKFTFTKDTSLDNEHTYACNIQCPIDYRCFSSKTKSIFSNDSVPFTLKVVEIEIKLFNISNHIVAPILFTLPNKVFVKFGAPKCNIKRFDDAFRDWKFSQLLILDLSYNSIVNSDDFKSLENFTKLKVMNFSHNENLKISNNFTFPRSLEIIDLSYTKIRTLKNNVFGKLFHLRHLNLSHTLVSEFIDMGIPEYYNLDTLRLEGIIISNITTDFFKGLKIESGLWVKEFTLCCSVVLNINISVDKCHHDYSISSCNNLVGDIFKRIVIWIVGLLTLVGNGIVLVDRIGWNKHVFKKAYDLFVTGLAISDFMMGFYLMIIAYMDIYFNDMYGLEDFTWRNSALCLFAGFISTLSSEASTFFICLITLDRFLAIQYTFGEHRFNTTGKLLSFIFVWLFAFLVALLPVVIPEWKIYSSNGLCLAMPFSFEKYNGWEFSFVIFVVLNFILFVCIALGQLAIFLNYRKTNLCNSIIRRNQSRRRQDLNVAKKLAFVALTDFFCWFPVGILGFISVLGHEFDLEIYAWVAVFVLPINSALNPIIYTLPAIYNKCTNSKVVISTESRKKEINLITL